MTLKMTDASEIHMEAGQLAGYNAILLTGQYGGKTHSNMGVSHWKIAISYLKGKIIETEDSETGERRHKK